VLLLAMVAAIVLTLEKQLQTKTQKASIQILETISFDMIDIVPNNRT